MKVKFSLALVITLLSLGTAAGAQSPVVDRDQLVGGTTVTWYNHPGTQGFTTATGLAGVTVTVSANPFVGWFGPCQAGGCWAGGFTQGDGILFAQSARRYTFSFSSYVMGFATQAWFHRAANTIGIRAFDQGALVATYSTATGGGWDGNFNQASVIGVNGVQFDRVELFAEDDYAVNQLSLVGMPQVNFRDAFDPNDSDAPLGPEVLRAPVSAVPEPSTYALMAAGLGALAAAARRRRA